MTRQVMFVGPASRYGALSVTLCFVQGFGSYGACLSWAACFLPAPGRADADARRFRSKDAFARHNGTAPLPVWSGNRERHRLSRTGNRQLNAAIHRIAITQMRCHDDAKAYLTRRRESGNTSTEALRALKRRLSDVVFRALIADAEPAARACLAQAA